MMFQRVLLSVVCVGFLCSGMARGEAFRVLPYLQNPAQDAMTIRWFSETSAAGSLTLETPQGPRSFRSEAWLAKALAYSPFGKEPGGPHPELPYLHRLRLSGLKPGTRYPYVVRQGGQTFAGVFRTAPAKDQPVRFVVYSDSETEPESSTSGPVDWPVGKAANRPEGMKRYLVNQTEGYRENLKIIAAREPDFMMIAGDIVESGGEQRDWDEFWRHNAGSYGSLAGQIPIFPALGNHENYAGPFPGGGFSARGAAFSVAKYRTYFEVPDNGSSKPRCKGRYYRIDYGPLALITVDSSDGSPAKSAADSNHKLEGDAAPDFNPGSEQYAWLERELSDAQRTCQFTFVQFHHTPYGSGPHSFPFGHPEYCGQSGTALRVLEPLLFRYGVDAVFAGHDELWERSLVNGTETLPDGSTRPHAMHFYDVGAGGDGLRGPVAGADNRQRQFLAHEDAPEVWNGRQLISGGKHYGHLEVNVVKSADGGWLAELVPAYAFPLTDPEGNLRGWERRTYDDTVTLFAAPR